MAASREPVVVGLLATEGLPAELAADIAEELPEKLSERLSGAEWRVEVSPRPAGAAGDKWERARPDPTKAMSSGSSFGLGCGG